MCQCAARISLIVRHFTALESLNRLTGHALRVRRLPFFQRQLAERKIGGGNVRLVASTQEDLQTVFVILVRFGRSLVFKDEDAESEEAQEQPGASATILVAIEASQRRC